MVPGTVYLYRSYGISQSSSIQGTHFVAPNRHDKQYYFTAVSRPTRWAGKHPQALSVYRVVPDGNS